MPSSLAGKIKVLVGFVVSGLAVALLFRNVDWERLLDAFVGAEYRWFLLSLLALMVEFYIRALRWRMLLAPVKYIPLSSLFQCMAVGYLVNSVLPGRLGEMVRGFLLARMEMVPPVVVLASVAVDRVLDVVVLAIALAAMLPTTQLPDWVRSSGAVIGVGGLVLLMVSVLLAYPFGRGALLAFFKITPPFPGKSAVATWIDALCLGVQGLKGSRAQLRVLLVSMLIWLASTLMFYCSQLAFHVGARAESALLVATITSMGAVVPSSPGYVGVFHYLVVLALDAYGVQREVALGFAVAVHLLLILPIGVVGALSLWRLGMTLGSVNKIQRWDDS